MAKLSEILAQPIKLKGGGILNLKGFSKRVIDKEIGGSGNNEYSEALATNFAPVFKNTWDKDHKGIISNELLLKGINNPLISINLNNFIDKIKTAAHLETNIVDVLKADFSSPLYNRNKWILTIYDVQPDDLKEFYIKGDTFSRLSIDLNAAIVPSLNCIYLYYDTDTISNFYYEPCSFYNFNDTTSSVYRGQDIVSAVTEKWRGIFFNPDSAIEDNSDYIIPALWIDGVSAINDEDYNYYKYIKFIGLKLSPILD